MKIHPMGTELFRPDRHDEANGPFLQFCESTYKFELFGSRKSRCIKLVAHSVLGTLTGLQAWWFRS